METRIIETIIKAVNEIHISQMDTFAKALMEILHKQCEYFSNLSVAQQKQIGTLEEKIAALVAMQATLFATLAKTAPDVFAQLVEEMKEAVESPSTQASAGSESIKLFKFFTEPEPVKQPERWLRLVPKKRDEPGNL